MRQTYNAVKDESGKYAVVGGTVAGSLAVVNQANAALDAGVATGMATVQTDFTALLALAYPIMISITVSLVIFGLVKMFIHKSAGK